MKLIIEVADEYYNECNRRLVQKVATIDQYVIAHGIEYVEPKKGKWIEHEDYCGDTYYTCSVCGEDWITIEGTPTNNMMNFCPNCGADMREADNE